MNITKGKKFLCIKDAVMINSNTTEYNKGKVYTSERNGCITDNSGAAHRQWTKGEIIRQYFQPLEEAKWAIRSTSENCKEINEWANANILDALSGMWFHSHEVSEGSCPRLHFTLHFTLQDGFTEIGIEAFREITEYLKSAEKIRTYQPKWGEKVEVSDDGNDWYIRTFIGFHPNSKEYPYVVCKDEGFLDIFKYFRPLQEKTFTVQEAVEALAEKHGIDVNQVKVSFQ